MKHWSLDPPGASPSNLARGAWPQTRAMRLVVGHEAYSLLDKVSAIWQWCDCVILVGGWTNPFEKYKSKWVHLPQIGVKRNISWNHHRSIFSRCLKCLSRWLLQMTRMNASRLVGESLNLTILCGLLGMLKWDLELGDKKATLNHLEYVFSWRIGKNKNHL